MKRLLSILLAVAMLMAFAMPAMAAEETETTEPEILADAYDMTYYVGGYGAMPGRYQCQVRYPDNGYAEWFDISFGDPIVADWPTEAGTYTVTFEKTTAIEGAGDTEYTFQVSLNITVQEMPETHGLCGEDMKWEFDTETATLTISGSGDMYTVAETDEDFQNGNYNYEPGWWYFPVEHIVVEEGVENLANYAFTQAAVNNYYEVLETIQLPTTLKAIPECGFLMADAMTSLTIPEGITSLTGWPFGYPGNSFLSLTELYLPSTLTELDPLTVMLSGLDNRTAGLTLETIHFAGTEEEWNAITLVDSESIKEIFGSDYEGFYENWCVPAKEWFAQCNVVFEPQDEFTLDISIDSPITMSEIYGILRETEDASGIFYDEWQYRGILDATIAGEQYEDITLDQFRELVLINCADTVHGLDFAPENQEDFGATWTVGESNACTLYLYTYEDTVEIPCQVVITESNIVSVSAEPVTYYLYETWRSPTFTVTYADGATDELTDVTVAFPEGMPTEAGTYSVKVIVGGKFETTVQARVLPAPTSGELGDTVSWAYDAETETLTLSGTGAATPDSEHDFMEIYAALLPKHVVVEEGIETLFDGIFHYSLHLLDISLPSTLKEIPNAFIGTNGPTAGTGLDEEFGDVPGMSTVKIPEGITSLTNAAFYLCWGISDYYLPSTLEEIDLDVFCYVTMLRKELELPALETTIHFAGTEEQWAQVEHVAGENRENYGTGLTDEELEEIFATFTISFEPKIKVENGTATVPGGFVKISQGEDVVIDVTDTDKDVSDVVIGAETVDKIADAKALVEIKLPDLTVSFDADAIGSIGEQAGDDAVKIVAKEVEENTLNTKQAAALEGKEVKNVFSLEAHAGDSKITEFGGGKVKVSIPFALPKGKTGDDFYVVHVAEDGEVTPVPTTYDDGALHFETTHFSNYVVLEEEAADPSNPPTGDSTPLFLLMVMAVISAAGLTACFTKRRAF